MDTLPRIQKFGTIYADPPWQYGNQATRSATSDHYRTMPLSKIMAMPIAELAAPESHLHLWTTNGFLREAFDVIEAWGFAYKSCFLWIKPEMGIGNYWRVSHEFLLLGVRGGCHFQDHSIVSWMLARRGIHSEKPDRIREIIEKVSPAPRLELFARVETPGWVCWGDEVSKNLFSEV